MEQERRRIHVSHVGRRICVLTWSNRAWSKRGGGYMFLMWGGGYVC
jgi:hypothetical protein